MALIIETDRLQIEEATSNDALFYVELMNSPSWLKYIGDRNIKSDEEAVFYLTNRVIKSYDENGFGVYNIRLKSENKLIGICGLLKREELKNVDIGYALLKNYEGKGYAREAANAVIEWAFSTLKINSLCAITTHDNLRSISLLAKLGFVVEKHFKMKLHDKEDFLLFTISKTK